MLKHRKAHSLLAKGGRFLLIAVKASAPALAVKQLAASFKTKVSGVNGEGFVNKFTAPRREV